MRRLAAITLRPSAVAIAFIVVTVGSYSGGLLLIDAALNEFGPQAGLGDEDPRGRGAGDVDTFGIGFFICFVLGAVGGWLAWIWTDRRNWSWDLGIASPAFLILAPVASANYISLDVIFTREAQAALNLVLAISGAVVALLLARSLTAARSFLLTVAGSTALAFCLYGFVAIPLWYSLSFLSWKQGAGELNSLDEAAKAVSAAMSLLAVLGLAWKDGKLTLHARPAKAE